MSQLRRNIEDVLSRAMREAAFLRRGVLRLEGEAIERVLMKLAKRDVVGVKGISLFE